MNPEESETPAGPPLVTMKELTFFPVCAEFIKPTKLVPRDTEQLKMAELSFTVSGKHFEGEFISSEVESGDDTFRVQLRLCLWDPRGPQEDCLPPQLIIIANGKLCFPPVEANGKRYNRPVDITHVVRPSDEVPNAVMLLWSLSDTRDFAMSVCLVKQFTAEELVQQLRKKASFPSSRTVSMIREAMPAVRDPSFGLRRLRVSLVCPLTQGLVSVPCRAVSCSHVQIFDAVPFLQRNEEEETWRCPVCDQEVVYRNLVVDEYFCVILRAITREEIDCEEIDILQDGTWVPANMRLDLLEMAGNPGYCGLRCQRQRLKLKKKVQCATLVEVTDSSAEVEASKKLPGPHPGAANLPSTSTAGTSTAAQGPAQGSENQTEVMRVKVVPQPREVCEARMSKFREMFEIHSPPRERMRRQRRKSRIPSGVLRDLLSCGSYLGSGNVPAGRPPDSSQEIDTDDPMDSSSSSEELQTPATTPNTGVRRPQQPGGESSSLDTRDCPSSRPKQ
ncbi:E3 SUMO-protein ligase PIAS3-like [Tachyglossus aculeatus]|uniref:E3 SUMO-protein ligase PIAS3-like n=1 Tax=Tachyglossus aculeatus TaxID=9261 RepID=UPI0018F762B6|nr:E3 SUMO-protein ligase PIAS3-like [Tachyglossus aculeatus]